MSFHNATGNKILVVIGGSGGDVVIVE